MATSPTAITALPTAPDPNDRSTFNARAYPWSVALTTWTTQANNIATVTYNNAVDAANQVTLAANQVTLAANQVTLATAQASAASTSATNAANSASAASTSATNASNSASDALASANAAAASYDSFDDRYLGPKSADPTVDNDGAALLAGALYFHTGSNLMKVFNGASWQATAGTVTGTSSAIREYQTATSNQTVFSLTNTYTPGTNSLQLYVNGVRLFLGDYTETNSTTVTLAAGLQVGDSVLFEIGVVSAGTAVSANATSFNPTVDLTAYNVQDAITQLASTSVSTSSTVASLGTAVSSLRTCPDYLLMSQGVI
jgi:hypothetical protein